MDHPVVTVMAVEMGVLPISDPRMFVDEALHC